MHPAIIILLKAHATARLRRFAQGFSSPRRILLSLCVIGLGCLWLGQTLASVLLRDAWEPNVFRSWVSLSLMTYFLWHIIRVAWDRSETPIEWLPEEEALIVGGPFSPAQVLTYRMCIIFTATIPKALLTAFVLWPDLSWSGPPGLLLSLVFLEMVRLLMDLAVSCLSVNGYRTFRAAVLLGIMAVIYLGNQHALLQWTSTNIQEVLPIPIGQHTMAVFQSMRHGTLITMMERPFLVAADLISGRGSVAMLSLKLLSVVATLFLLAQIIRLLDQTCRTRRLAHERKLWRHSSTSHSCVEIVNSATHQFTLPSTPLARWFGPLVWRQSKRAWRFFGSLAVSMGIPALLSCPPLHTIEDPTIAFILVVCGVLFYTFVLLPEAIKFDFRLDSDYLCQLRMLPITPARMVAGQLAVPIALAVAFQTAVITFAGWYREIGVLPVICANAIVVPLTIVFVAIDNLIFLLYPHRPTQEGFEAFLRAILKFTGKSLLLTLAAGAILLWVPTAAYLASTTQAAVSTPVVFYCGAFTGVVFAVVLVLRMVVRAYNRFDTSFA